MSVDVKSVEERIADALERIADQLNQQYRLAFRTTVLSMPYEGNGRISLSLACGHSIKGVPKDAKYPKLVVCHQCIKEYEEERK